MSLKIEERQRVEDWVDDNLTPEGFEAPLKSLINEDSGLFQELVSDYLKGDGAEFDNTSGRLARALISHIKRSMKGDS